MIFNLTQFVEDSLTIVQIVDHRVFFVIAHFSLMSNDRTAYLFGIFESILTNQRQTYHHLNDFYL